MATEDAPLLSEVSTGCVVTMDQVSYTVPTKTEVEKTLLRDVSLVVRPGELLAIMGGSGAGKSTLLHLLQGRLPTTTGSVDCDCKMALMPQRANIDWTFPITVKREPSGRSSR